jgi:hypothetical protein
MEDLQVHHIQPRSRLGDDTAEILIALSKVTPGMPTDKCPRLPAATRVAESQLQ